MELKELHDKILQLFGVSDAGDLGAALINGLYSEELMDRFVELVGNDLSVDWLQKIFQYYRADRKEKKQDYTPGCLGEFMSLLIGDADTVVDLCAGTGALVIQRWVQNKEQAFELYEIDENVIPYLLFNMAVRNIQAVVRQENVLLGTLTAEYIVQKGEKYGHVLNIKSAL